MSNRRDNINRIKNLKFEKKAVVKKIVDADVNKDGIVDEKDIEVVKEAVQKKKKKSIKKEK